MDGRGCEDIQERNTTPIDWSVYSNRNKRNLQNALF